MKKAITFIFILILSFALVGCKFNKLILKENFSNNLSSLNVIRGYWDIDNGELCAKANNDRGADILIPNYVGRDYSVSVDITILDEPNISKSQNAGILFRSNTDASNNFYAMLQPYQGKEILLGTWRNNTWTDFRDYNKVYFKIGEKNRLRVICKGNGIEVYLNNMDNPLIIATRDDYFSGQIGLRAWNAHAHFDNLVIEENKE